MPYRLEQALFSRWLSGGDDAGAEDDGHSEFGVHVTYDDIYNSILFLTCIYVSGQIASRLLRMPNLVGEIVAGILLGPPLADFVPLPEAWVLLGEIGLILLVIEAGIDIDLDTLKLIGARGFVIAFIGSVLPIGLGMAVAFSLGLDAKAAIAAGASFGPTSLGIALNILRSGGILNTPVGQLIISAAVIDDMIALVVLSQLRALAGTITVAGILIPVVSALLFLVLGGYLAIYILPGLINKYILVRVPPEHHSRLELAIMLGMLLALMPATFYAKASFLMGAFVAGLTFCGSHGLHHEFVSQFKRVLQWLMRIFFAASIGFQVPVTQFGSGEVILKGLFFTVALLGKLAAGFLVPNFTQTKRFTGLHFRDCLITGFSLAAEGEFAFVIAVFAVDAGLIDTKTYSSIVLAVLLSTIVPPFALRYTITWYNKKAEEAVLRAAEEEIVRRHDLESFVEITEEQREEQLRLGIKNQTVVFLCIQTQSDSRWGLMHSIMNALQKLGLEVIDHRSWHPRGVNTTLVNEIYVRDNLILTEGKSTQQALDDRIETVKGNLMEVMNQPEVAKVKVTRWYPGVVSEIVDQVEEKVSTQATKSTATLEERLLNEATMCLETKRTLQTNATQEKSLKELVGEMNLPIAENSTVPLGDEAGAPAPVVKKTRNRRVRQKMRSTPVFGGSLFGEDTNNVQTTAIATSPTKTQSSSDTHGNNNDGLSALDAFNRFRPSGQTAELTINGEAYQIRVSDDTLKNLRKGYHGETLDRKGFALRGSIEIESANAPVVNMLQGYVRNTKLSNIAEETNAGDGTSDGGSTKDHTKDDDA